MSDIHYVVGSGPSGVACAYALLERGKRVVMLDCGQKIEKEAEARYLQDFRSQTVTYRDPRYFKHTSSKLGKIPLKIKYGSDFCYDAEQLTLHNAAVCGSKALGGLSNVWGAAILPFRKEEIKHWPISFSDLETGYTQVAQLFNLMAEQDDNLESEFPFYTKKVMSLQRSAQAQYVYKKMSLNRKALHEQGLHFSYSRLAFNQEPAARSGCTHCGLCFYGCPSNQIFCSADSLPLLLKYPHFEYRPNIVVQKFTENAKGVFIEVTDLNTNERSELTGSSIFLGAGVLNTAKIVAASRPSKKAHFTALDTDYFLIPALMFKAFSRKKLQEVFTLGQLFLEAKLPNELEFIHLQIYTYNEVVRQELKNKMKKVPFLKPFAEFLMKRMIVIQGFLPSTFSSTLDLHIQNNQSELTGVRNPQSKKLIQQIKRLLLKNSRRLGFLPLTLATEIGLPGRGFHIGGTLPMVSDTALTPNSTDHLGRLSEYQNVYIVDASVFPSIPSATITYTVMANAYRIASHA